MSGRILRGSAVVVVAVGLVLSVIAARDEPVELLFYFTVQVNLAYLVVLLAGGGDRLRTALAVYLVGTALVFVLVLANPWSGYAMVATADARGPVSDAGNLLLHAVAAVAAVIMGLAGGLTSTRPANLMITGGETGCRARLAGWMVDG
ncbi:hypothetical protein V6V47_29390 [Micromonospora sp. CPCC 205539]|uniref:hypothetical protein n=1 Tax=Micromonospora sp. CPCC 205539 TaxID=3122408 RepID=UPI002FEEA9D6